MESLGDISPEQLLAPLTIAIALLLSAFHAFLWRAFSSRLHYYLTIAWATNSLYLLFESVLGHLSAENFQTRILALGLGGVPFFALAGWRIVVGTKGNRPHYSEQFFHRASLFTLLILIASAFQNASYLQSLEDSAFFVTSVVSFACLAFLAESVRRIRRHNLHELINAGAIDYEIRERTADATTREGFREARQKSDSENIAGRRSVVLGYAGYALLQLAYPWLGTEALADYTVYAFLFSAITKLVTLYGFSRLTWSHLKLIESSAKLSEVAEQVGALTYGIEHDLRQPVSEMRNLFERKKIKYQHQKDVLDFIRELESISDRILEVKDIVKLMRETPEEMARSFRPVNLSTVCKQAFRSVKDFYPNADLHSDLHEAPSETFVRANSSQLRRAISNVFNNSVESVFLAKGDRQSAFISCRIGIDKELKLAEIKIVDSGVGLEDEETRERMFDAYYTTKDVSRKNSGIGLFTAKKIIQAHGGSIGAANRDDGTSGVVVDITIPTNKEK